MLWQISTVSSQVSIRQLEFTEASKKGGEVLAFREKSPKIKLLRRWLKNKSGQRAFQVTYKSLIRATWIASFYMD